MADLRVHDLWPGACPLLGPSLYVWVQGCPRRCYGCFNQATLDENGPARVMTPVDLASVWRQSGGGVVLSGGEPFSQSEGLAQFCKLVRAIEPETPILVYTGYLFRELLAGGGSWLDLLRQVDVLVDGPYVYDRQTDSALLGSDNQRVFFLSRRVPPERLNQMPRAHVQVSLSADSTLRIVGTGGTGRLDMNGLIDRLRASGVDLLE